MSTPDRETLSVDVENLEDALTRVQWVRNGTGTGYHCHFCGGVPIQDGGDDHADDCEWRRLTSGDISKKVAEQAERIATLTAQVEQLHEALGQASSVCACGCPTSEHENYGEDGESCGVDGHSCYQTSLAALFEMRAFRAQVEQQAQEIARLREALNEVLSRVIYRITTARVGYAPHTVYAAVMHDKDTIDQLAKKLEALK